MKRFSINTRVRVKAKSGIPEGLRWKSGIVRRCRISDHGAWVEMDMPPSQDLRSFPEGDSRANHVLLYPSQCEQEKKP